MIDSLKTRLSSIRSEITTLQQQEHRINEIIKSYEIAKNSGRKIALYSPTGAHTANITFKGFMVLRNIDHHFTNTNFEYNGENCILVSYIQPITQDICEKYGTLNNVEYGNEYLCEIPREICFNFEVDKEQQKSPYSVQFAHMINTK